MVKKNNIIKKLMTVSINVLFWGCCALLTAFFFQLFCFTSFKIPSDSMNPTLIHGDRILVNKLILGARLLNVSASLNGKQVEIYRVPGLGKIKRNDVLVFNFPYVAFPWDSIRMDIMQYHVKRCIATPGDTLEIKKGFYCIRGQNGVLGNCQAQRFLAELVDPKKLGIVTRTFPRSELLKWTIREFGPLPIPHKGQEVMMNDTTYLLYRQLINWEQKKKLRSENGKFLLGDSLIVSYQFKKNYYFVSGDNMPNSQDSRYWGMLPEEYIVGKATHIWNSIDKYTEKTRWERIMMKIK